MAGPCVKWSDSCESVPDRFYDVRARAHWAMWRAHRWILAQVGTLCIICHIYCDTESSKMETTVSLLSRIRCFVCLCLSYHVSLAGQCDVTRKTATTLYRTETLSLFLTDKVLFTIQQFPPYAMVSQRSVCMGSYTVCGT